MTGTDNLPTGTESTPVEVVADGVPELESVEPVAAPTSVPTWAASQWHGRMLVDREGRHIGKLQDVYVDVETDVPMFATVKEGLWPGRHLTFVPLLDVQVEPEELRVAVDAERVSSAPDLELHGQELSQADESALYHHFQQNYVPPATPSGRRLARR
jgi:sporulation protein YlmC with PRC-barrel domain